MVKALHFVLKVGNLKKNVEFFRDLLKMRVLRHEIFEKGCEAACNGPYDGKWSKTMIGYGPEDKYFVLELTYNYSIGGYKIGNDFQHIKIAVEKKIYDDLKSQLGSSDGSGNLSARSPDGYKFLITSRSEKSDIVEVSLSCSDLQRSIAYWSKLLGMQLDQDASNDRIVHLSYSTDQARLVLNKIDDPVDHASAYGRIAFSCPSSELKGIQKAAEDASQRVLTPYVSLITPGKATVEVVILADPDGHEICFVGEEAFIELSALDTNANELIEKSIAEDRSDEWYQQKNKKKDLA